MIKDEMKKTELVWHLKTRYCNKDLRLSVRKTKNLKKKSAFYSLVKTALKIKAVGFVLRNMKINASHKKFSTLKNYSKKMQN